MQCSPPRVCASKYYICQCSHCAARLNMSEKILAAPSLSPRAARLKFTHIVYDERS